MTDATIAFIGGGNMATSLIAGLIDDGYQPSHLVVSDPDRDKTDALSRRFGVRIAADNVAALNGARAAVLCVKPQMAQRVCSELGVALAGGGLLCISIMAGIREGLIRRWLGGSSPVVRAMPNTPAMIQSGAIGLYAASDVAAADRDLAETILRAGGVIQWVEREDLMDVITALSGSGPAYYFALMESMERAGVELGLDAQTARLLTIQTALGAARLAMESDDPPQTLRERVTSPGGTTERALGVLADGGFDELVQRAIAGARERSIELSNMLAETK